jgi:cell division septation protein DedD
MISRDELIKIVAQSCGISVEISSFFFEVFVNRISNKLKPGDLLHFHDHGYFHKRNCRIQLEKSHDSPIPKSYLIQLVIFSEEAKIKSDLSSLHFLKIANLKNLWVDDKDFQKSLSAGDFAPHTDRNQLIKSFATKAEVIIAGLRKDYDSELVEELIIPLTFDLNFLIKSGQKNKSVTRTISDRISGNREESKQIKTKEPEIPKVPKESFEEAKTVTKKVDKTGTEETLPWSYGAKFLDKEKQGQLGENQIAEADKKEKPDLKKIEDEVQKEPAKKLTGFEPVSSRLSPAKEDKDSLDDGDTVKYIVSSTTDTEEQKEEVKFTEVKSKTDAFRYQSDKWKSKSKFGDKGSSRTLRSDSRDNVFRHRRSFLPFVAILAFIVIGAIVIYIYFIKESPQSNQKPNVIANVQPPPSVEVIERDYEYAVTYPYPKTEEKAEVSGYNKDILLTDGTQPVVDTKLKPEVKQESTSEVKSETKPERIPETEINTPPPVKEEQKIVEAPKEEKSNRIFLYKNFYVVYIASYKSEEDANREADRYFDLGYNAIVESVERGRNPEYRLIVGDFTSIEFAKQFQEKYIK